MKRAIIIFTRIPVAGQTKTRMMPYLSAAECAKLHTCFLEDIRTACQGVEADVFVCYTPKKPLERLYEIFGKEVSYFPQEGEGLGDRMYGALAYVLGLGYEACVLIGTDIPEIRTEHLRLAFRVLEDQDIVFGPTTDGGYYLIGMKEPSRIPFENQSYGHSSVLDNAIAGVEAHGLRAGLAFTLHDMDCREDLAGYRERMRGNPELQRTAAGRYLMRTSRISVIVPVYNEETTIVQLQKQLRPYQDKCEIIFVDGGSTDGTLELLSPEFRLLHSEKGRAKQMNLGARESHGDILFFLHCDSELPKDFLAEIRYVMKDHRAGCFGIAFHKKHFFLWTCRVISNHRIKDRKVMFGDQGIFLTRELFFEMGTFPEIPVMEDYQFSLTLKENHVKLGMAKHRIYTSDRRFPKGTIPKLEVMWRMNRLRKQYRDGVPIEEIADRYRDIR